jgi:hypothetical protein
MHVLDINNVAVLFANLETNEIIQWFRLKVSVEPLRSPLRSPALP